MPTNKEIDLVHEYLLWQAESDNGSVFEKIEHEFAVVSAICVNNNAHEWLQRLVDEFLPSATEWKELENTDKQGDSSE